MDNIRLVDDDFFLNDTLFVAKNLIGKIIVRENRFGEKIGGRIIETEAYLAENDEASHSISGKTKRNAPMFAKAGSIYVYLIYGIHLCLNIATESEGKGAAVLIRAIEPIFGIDIMKSNRKTMEINNLANGPGKLTIALGTTLDDNFKLINHSNYLLYTDGLEYAVVETPRIGISKAIDLPYRFTPKAK